jgi:hypothetical protein
VAVCMPACRLTHALAVAQEPGRTCVYCSRRSRYAFAALDRQTSVVASPRLALAAADTWQGILTHEWVAHTWGRLQSMLFHCQCHSMSCA